MILNTQMWEWEDRKPAWMEAMPVEEPVRWERPPDGFQPGPRPSRRLSGNFVSRQGKLREWGLHETLMRPERLMVMAQLAAHGPTRTMDLCAITGISHKKIGAVLRGLWDEGLIESAVVPGKLHPPRPSTPSSGEVGTGGGRRGHPAREWSITPFGRQPLWRFAFVSLRTMFAPYALPPLREDVDEDPVEAIRRHVVPMWLRPSGLEVVFMLRSKWGMMSLNRLCRLSGMNPGLAQPLLKRMIWLGWAEAHPTEVSVDAAGVVRPTWKMSEAGDLTLARHLDALRRAGRATGWTLNPTDRAYDILDENGNYRVMFEDWAASAGGTL